MDAFKLAIMSNLSLCCYHQTEYAQSAFYACKAMDHDPGSVKLLLRRARALSMKVREGPLFGASIVQRLRELLLTIEHQG